MTIDVGQFSTASFGTAATNTTGAINTSASGSSFFIFIVYVATSAAVADNKSNSYSQVGSTLVNFVGAGVNAAIFQVTNGTGGSGHTATVTLTAGSASEIYLFEVTGGATASLVDAITSAFWNDKVGSPYTSNNVSTANAIDLLVAFTATATTAGTEALTWGNSFTQVVSEANANNFTSAIAKRAVSSTGTYSSTFTASGAGTSEAATAVIALKSAATPPSNQEVEAPNRPRPGRGPFSKNKFRLSDTTAYTSASGVLSGLAGIVFGQSGILIGLTPEVEPPNRPRPGRGPFSKGRFYVSDTTAYTGSSSSALAGTATLTFGETGALLGAGALAATSALTFGSSATLNGAGGLAGTSALIFSVSGTAALAGAMAGTSALTFGTTGLLAGAGALSATSALTFASTAALQGTGVLAGTSALLIGASGTLSAAGGGTASLIIDASGTLSATGTLAGLTALLMSASGSLIDANAAPLVVPIGGGGGGFVRKKKLGPVMRDDQVFGETYPIASRETPARLEQALEAIERAPEGDESVQATLRALMKELL